METQLIDFIELKTVTIKQIVNIGGKECQSIKDLPLMVVFFFDFAHFSEIYFHLTFQYHRWPTAGCDVTV